MNLRLPLAINTWPNLSRYANGIFSGVVIAGGLTLLVALRLGWIDILPQTREVVDADPANLAAIPTEVALPPEKFAAARLHLARVEWQSIQPTRTVPGTLAYDAAKRVPVHAPVAGVVTQVLVEPSQQVSVQQSLAVLSSPEVGLARDDVLRHEADLALALKTQNWAEEVAKNVDELLALLAQKPKLEEAEAALARRTLGDYREKIFAPYSKLVLAELLVGGTDSLEAGTLSRRLIDERRSGREVAAAQFAAACETARFSAGQERDKARAAAEQAERLLAVAQQRLANLLGPLADMTPVTDRWRLSELVLVAPLAGRIEERQAVQAARVSAGDPLFTIADTSAMWVSAEIHERDWQAIDFAAKSSVRVRIPALEDSQFTAKVLFVGSQVASETRSVPLMAEIANAGGSLKPGMFVWVEVPLGKSRQALVVPNGAIMRHENQPFVFVPAGERTFRRVDIELGLEAGDHVEVISGLSAGDQVVERGAFYLKSELLLEREE
jgi:membrane fusion protein, heavy metal efflux system